jgi:hypothetical protein
MERRAKSISYEQLLESGKLVAELLHKKHAKTFGNAQVAYFPDIETQGAKERFTETIGQLSLNELVGIADEANALLNTNGDFTSSITITGGHIIFGGNPIPPDFFSMGPLG